MNVTVLYSAPRYNPCKTMFMTIALAQSCEVSTVCLNCAGPVPEVARADGRIRLTPLGGIRVILIWCIA